ncbi:MAG: enoyl-CoA hydratase/isomerase family protein [Acidobacteria bacterium]|nr:enoyl-CoA hydratase/isomerase family protein [Acidobacteriota bacterium]
MAMDTPAKEVMLNQDAVSVADGAAKTSDLYIQVEISDNVARLTMNRPPYNVLTISMMEEMSRAIEKLHEQRQVRAILLRASPQCQYFSAGVAAEDSRPDRAFQMLEALKAVFLSMLETSKPVITIVNGPAIGGGCELAALGDIIIATPKARFAQPEVRLGVFPPLAAVILPHVIGYKRALEMILTGEPLSAQDALRLGLVSKVVPEEHLEEEVSKILAKITGQSAPVLETAKKVLYDTIGLPLGTALKKSVDIFLNQLMDLDDAQEGLRAAIENRKPVWKDR